MSPLSIYIYISLLSTCSLIKTPPPRSKVLSSLLLERSTRDLGQPKNLPSTELFEASAANTPLFVVVAVGKTVCDSTHSLPGLVVRRPSVVYHEP